MDPISDMLIRIKNAAGAGHETVSMPYSRMKYEIARALERARLVAGIQRKGKRVRKILEIGLLETGGFSSVRLLSGPGRRTYAAYRDLHRAPRGGVIILTTSKGIMTEREARKEKVGGQLIAEVW